MTSHGSSRRSAAHSATNRLGGWLPGNSKHLARWLKTTKDEAKKKAAAYHPVIQEFKDLIESDPLLFMYFTQMFEEQPDVPTNSNWGDIKLRDYREMLDVINHVLSIAPIYDHTEMVGFPINAILDYPMITPAGLAAFAVPRVNEMFRKILRAWTEFLDSEASCYVLNDSPTGWLCPDAWNALGLDEYQMRPDAPYLGFKSWNDFFIRKFKPGQRPVAVPDDHKVIVSACESQPFAIKSDVSETDTFWAKSQPYSLRHLLNDNYVDKFVGGTVYQAFLSAKNYHRWHSPISGTVKMLQKVPGTYYAEAPSVGFDEAGPNNSQGYIAHVATRALIFIEADHRDIGLVCLIPIGMAEVSSCVLEQDNGEPLKVGQHVKKGEQVGYFQFGGSTHCLVFGRGVIASFAAQAIPWGPFGAESANVPVNSFLAKVR